MARYGFEATYRMKESNRQRTDERLAAAAKDAGMELDNWRVADNEGYFSGKLRLPGVQATGMAGAVAAAAKSLAAVLDPIEPALDREGMELSELQVWTSGKDA